MATRRLIRHDSVIAGLSEQPVNQLPRDFFHISTLYSHWLQKGVMTDHFFFQVFFNQEGSKSESVLCS